MSTHHPGTSEGAPVGHHNGGEPGAAREGSEALERTEKPVEPVKAEAIDTSYLYVKREDKPATLRPVDPPHAWQSVWFQARKRPWRSLAVVPVDDQASLSAARTLQLVGRMVEGSLVTLVDATGVTLDAARDLLAALDGPPSGGRIIAVDSPAHRPSAIPLARTADACVLLVELGSTSVEKARKVMELVGTSRFVGAVATRGRRGRKRRGERTR